MYGNLAFYRENVISLNYAKLKQLMKRTVSIGMTYSVFFVYFTLLFIKLNKYTDSQQRL